MALGVLLALIEQPDTAARIDDQTRVVSPLFGLPMTRRLAFGGAGEWSESAIIGVAATKFGFEQQHIGFVKDLGQALRLVTDLHPFDGHAAADRKTRQTLSSSAVLRQCLDASSTAADP